MEVALSAYGAAITLVKTPDRDGRLVEGEVACSSAPKTAALNSGQADAFAGPKNDRPGQTPDVPGV